MVVKSNKLQLEDLDLAYLGLFLGLRVNELVMARLVQKGFQNVRESQGYLIQHLIEGERSITELAQRMNVTQQAASKSVAELVRMGVLEELAGEDRRTKRIRLSEQGWKGVRAARQIRGELEKRIQAATGAREYERAKRALVACIEDLGGAERIRARRVRQPD